MMENLGPDLTSGRQLLEIDELHEAALEAAAKDAEVKKALGTIGGNGMNSFGKASSIGSARCYGRHTESANQDKKV